MASMNKIPWTYLTYAKLLPTLTRTPSHTKGKEPQPENRRGRVGNKIDVNSKTNKIRMKLGIISPSSIFKFPAKLKPVLALYYPPPFNLFFPHFFPKRTVCTFSPFPILTSLPPSPSLPTPFYIILVFGIVV